MLSRCASISDCCGGAYRREKHTERDGPVRHDGSRASGDRGGLPLQFAHRTAAVPASPAHGATWSVFTAIVAFALKPKAQEEKHPQAFYNGLRLVAVDGTEFSVTNTPQILGPLAKAGRGA